MLAQTTQTSGSWAQAAVEDAFNAQCEEPPAELKKFKEVMNQSSVCSWATSNEVCLRIPTWAVEDA